MAYYTSSQSPVPSSPTSSPGTSADITPIQKPEQAPQMRGGGRELTLTWPVKIALTGDNFISAWDKLVGTYPPGSSFLWGSYSFPLLRVIDYDITWVTKEYAFANIYYSTEDSWSDIEYSYEIGATTVQTTQDKTGTELGDDPNGNPIVATIHCPTNTFTYARTESDYGYYDGGGRIAWSSQRYSWGPGSSTQPLSQRNRVYNRTAQTNSTLFLGGNTGTWLFLGATAERLGANTSEVYAWDDVRYRTTYRFAYRPYRARAWQFVNPYDGTLDHIYEQGTFSTYLDLKWPTVEGGGYL